MPEGIRPVYTVSMLLSALGHFSFIYIILFRLAPAETLIGGRFGYSLFYAIFLMILIPSALWMPLTNVYVGNSSQLVWFAVCARGAGSGGAGFNSAGVGAHLASDQGAGLGLLAGGGRRYSSEPGTLISAQGKHNRQQGD